jgi:hypothetical protein
MVIIVHTVLLIYIKPATATTIESKMMMRRITVMTKNISHLILLQVDISHENYSVE